MEFRKFFMLLSLIVGTSYGRESRGQGAFAELKDGSRLIGQSSVSRNGMTFFKFMGVPYGKIPARFQISEAFGGWEGIRNATQVGPKCVQIDQFSGNVSGVEDCLVLNVFKPEIAFKHFKGKTTRKLPVLFAIHEGGFRSGQGADLRPEYLIDQDLIIVTPNYRLGPMGFLNAGVESARGNQGLKDLVLALEWVQLNIEKFGGDPDRVVIQGSASASHAVSFLILSPLTKGLFSGAISQGGAALCPSSANQFGRGKALLNAQKLAQRLDCPSTNSEYLVKCLERLDPKVILEQTLPSEPLNFETDSPSFGPSLETHQTGDSDPNVFLSQHPVDILTQGTFNKVAYILGTDSLSGLIPASIALSNESLRGQLNEKWGRVAPNTFLYEEVTPDPCVVSGQIRDFYFKGGNVSGERSEELMDLYADRLSYHCTRKTALLFAPHAPLYLYNFNWQQTSGEITGFVDSMFQLDANKYLFPSSHPTESIGRNSSAYQFSEQFVKLWSSFVKDGQPRCEDCKTTWTKFNPNESPLKWFNIKDEPEVTVEDQDFTSRMQFWDNLPLNEGFVNGDMELTYGSTPKISDPNYSEQVTTLSPNDPSTDTPPIWTSISPKTTPSGHLSSTLSPSSRPTTTTTSMRTSPTGIRNEPTRNTFQPPQITNQSTTILNEPKKIPNQSLTITNQPIVNANNQHNATTNNQYTTIRNQPTTNRSPPTTDFNDSTTNINQFPTIIDQPTTVPSSLTNQRDQSSSSTRGAATTTGSESRQGNERAISNNGQKMTAGHQTTSDPQKMFQVVTSKPEMTFDPVVMSQTLEREEASPASKNKTSKIKVTTSFAFNGTLVLSLLFPLSHQNASFS